MEFLPQIKTITEHPFRTYLNQQVPVQPHKNEAEGEAKASVRLLHPGELELLITKHQEWLDSENYQKWVGTSTEEKNRYFEGRADLSHCDLQGVNLENANLRDAVLWQSNFRGASLKNINLERADLWGANFESANLYRAQLSHSDAWDVNFLGANLYGADLRNAAMGGANFQKASLADAQLQQAYFGECNFQEADLTRSNLFRADLREAVFQDANLVEANFRDTNLQHANLLRSSGLQESSVAGAILSDSSCPEEYGTFRHGLRFLEATSKTITKGLFLLLLISAYAILTVWSTSDAQFLTNSSASGLPIIRVGVPVTSFVLFSSLLLLAVYIYWHLYAETVWKGVAQLPAIFPNSRSLDQELFPWIVNGFIRPNVFHLKKMLSVVVHMQHVLLQVLIWWIVPFTIGLCWLVLLPLHNWNVTSLQIILVVIAVFGATFFQQRSNKILRGEHHGDPLLHTAKLSRQGWWKPFVMGTIVLCITVIVSDGAINGMPLKMKALLLGAQPRQVEFVKEELQRRVQGEGYLSIHRTLVPIVLPFLGMRAFADISNLDLSERTGNMVGQGKNGVLLHRVKGAQLEGANLHHLSGTNAFLKHANLQQANLRKANLASADLESASLIRTNLQHANLRKANLKGGNLFEANLQGAELHDANLQQANLFEANMSKAGLVGAKLQKSTFVGANLQETVLNGANASGANMGKVILKQASLQATTLTNVNFFEANLDHANFYGANLRDANLGGATLQQTKLEGVDLSSVKNLTQTQLNQACLNSRTKLPKNLVRPKVCQSNSP